MHFGMRNRPGEHARSQLRHKWRHTAITNARVLVVLAVVAGVLCAVELLLPAPLWWRSYLLGFFTASLLGVGIWALDLFSGTHNLRLGMMGEQATAEAVLGWRQRREGWKLVNGLFFGGHGDVDHLLIGPGGVYVLESKWTNVPWRLVDEGIVGPVGRDPITQAQEGARKVESMLRYGRDRFEVDVHPVVVLWGPGAPVIEGGWSAVGDVKVFEGRQAKNWKPQLNRDALSDEVVCSITNVLEAELSRRVDRTVRSFSPSS
jgi:hypothetical protein